MKNKGFNLFYLKHEIFQKSMLTKWGKSMENFFIFFKDSKLFVLKTRSIKKKNHVKILKTIL